MTPNDKPTPTEISGRMFNSVTELVAIMDTKVIIAYIEQLERENIELREVVKECVETIKKNHQWHQEHGEYDGYGESDLCEVNCSAISNPIVQSVLKGGG